MTLHKHKSSSFTLKTGLKVSVVTALSAFILFAPTYADALGKSVIDKKANSKLNEIDSTTKQNLTEEERQTKLMEEQLASMGEAGSGMSIINSPAFTALGSSSEFYSNMEKFGFDMCAINLCQTGENPSETTDIAEAREWAHNTFFSSVHLSDDKLKDLVEVRRRAAAYTSANAFALSTTIHNELASAGGSAKAMEDLVDSAGSFREDIQNNSAVALLSYKVALQQLAVLSAMLDLQASQAVLEADLYHEEGGTEVPDAYMEGDFGDDGIRRRLTLPSKGTAN